jgi:hypothetical protein
VYLENDSGRAEREGRPPASQISIDVLWKKCCERRKAEKMR